MAEYLRYQLKNIEPLRITDDSASQSGQTSTLKYIAGSTIRGAVITALAKRSDFEKNKKVLFSDSVRFLNAYPEENGRELIPSPRGFCEDKTEGTDKKEIRNVVIEGMFEAGMKGASLDEFCYISDGTIFYYPVDTGSDLKIKFNLENENEKRNVFRNDYISAGHIFTGYIVITDSSVKDLIEHVLEGELIFGNSRSSGFGKCELISKEFVSYERTVFAMNAPAESMEGKCYMMLYSHTVMRDEAGEYTGLNLKALEKKMGVSDLAIEHCATSTRTIHGYNRKLEVKLPTVPMYEQGSIFKLTYKGVFTAERIREVMESGIGIRKNEGFGQVLFLKEYEGITWKQEGIKRAADLNGQQEPMKNQDTDTIRIVASNYYRRLLKKAMEKKIVDSLERGNLPNSQVGKLESLLIANKYKKDAKDVIKRYFENALEKENRQKQQKTGYSIKPFQDFVMNILDCSYAEYIGVSNQEIMGISVDKLLSEDELNRMKLEYLIELIRYDNRRKAET